MAVNILMPALSPTMTEGTLAKWLVNEGDTVASGNVIAEIETDKATMEVESIDEGTIGKILVQEGSSGVPVNAVIAILLEDGEDKSALDAASSNPLPTPKSAEAPTSKTNLSSRFEVTPIKQQNNNQTRVFASPLARKIAQQESLDLSTVTGTGPKGRIIKQDVESALAANVTKQRSAPCASAPSFVDARTIADAFALNYDYLEADGMRKTIAARLSESKATIPHFRVSMDCRLDKLLELRKEINAELDEGKVSVNDFIIRASALALKAVPEANASWIGNGFIRYHNAHISVAVAIEGGLITPVVRKAEEKSLVDISSEIRDLAARAKSGKLAPNEYQGGTFSISNLGMFGVKQFDAIINPPESAILAIGAGEKRPIIAEDGSIIAATVMNINLSCDHRVIDGAVGARFLGTVKALIESPLKLLL